MALNYAVGNSRTLLWLSKPLEISLGTPIMKEPFPNMLVESVLPSTS